MKQLLAPREGNWIRAYKDPLLLLLSESWYLLQDVNGILPGQGS